MYWSFSESDFRSGYRGEVGDYTLIGLLVIAALTELVGRMARGN